MDVEIEDLVLNLKELNDRVIVSWNEENIFLANQKIKTVSELINDNFYKVYHHYKFINENCGERVVNSEIRHLSLQIVLHYLYMYNGWRSLYENQKNRDLKFKEEDFEHPTTHDLVFSYFQKNHSDSWKEKCAALMELPLETIELYYQRRLDFYNK